MIRVLLVDDVRLLAEVEGTALGRDVVEIRVTGGTGDIARAARECQPAVVVLGEGEACPDALEMCRRIRTDPATRAVSIIYIGMGLNRERARLAGADVFIPRPFTRLELREAFQRVLRLRDRIAVRRQVSFDVELSTGEDVSRGTCRDLSLSGAFMTLDRELQPGERGTLRFEAGSRRFQLAVHVVRRGRGACGLEGVGVAFLGLDADTGAFLSRYVRTIPAGASDAGGPFPGDAPRRDP